MAPFFSSSSQYARPMPAAPPVTMATLPLMSIDRCRTVAVRLREILYYDNNNIGAQYPFVARYRHFLWWSQFIILCYCDKIWKTYSKLAVTQHTRMRCKTISPLRTAIRLVVSRGCVIVTIIIVIGHVAAHDDWTGRIRLYTYVNYY